MVIHNPILTGSFTVNNIDVSSITSSAANISSINAITASILSTTGSLNTASGSAITRLGALEVTSGSNITRLSALETASGSAITRLGALEVTSGSNITRLGALETASGSAITRLGSIEVVTGSNITRLSSLEAKTGSYATTGSNTFIGSQVVSGSIVQSGSFTTTGTIIAQTINVQTVTSSIVYSSGSNIFGNLLGDSQTFTGSVLVTGSLTISTGGNASAPIIFGSTIACSPIGCFATSCATSFIGGTMSGTTIYGSTAVCSPVGKFTTCIDAGSGNFSSNFCVGGGLVVQQASTFVNTVGLFGGSAQLYIGATSNASDFAVLGWCSTNKSLNIQNQSTANNPQLIIACDGKVGVAVRDPIVQLHVRTNVASESRPTNLATSATNSAVYFTTIAGSNAGIAFGQLGANSNYIQSTYENGSACTPLILNPYSGNVGIGTGNTALDVKTHLYNASGRTDLRVESAGGDGAYATLQVKGGGANAWWTLFTNSSAIGGAVDNLGFYKEGGSAGVKMVITNCGNVAIGGTNTDPLSLARDRNLAIVTTGTNAALTIIGGGAARIDFGVGSTRTAGIYSDTSNFLEIFTSTALPIVFSPNASQAMRITSGGSVGIAATNPRTQLDVGDIVNGVGGTTFCAFLVAQGTWATFACVTNGDTNVITDITYVNNNDYNRSGVFVARWAYNSACAALHIVSCLWNDSQNINQFGLRNNSGALQICLGGGANGYRVQARVQGARATG